MNNYIYAFLISCIAGLSTMIGYLFIFLKPKNIDRFLSTSLSFSAILMIFISIFDLIPSSFFYLFIKYKLLGLFLIIISFLCGVGVIYIFNKFININSKNNSLFKVGILSAIVLMIHNIPEGIITFITSQNNIKLGIKISTAIMLHNIPEGICIAVPIYYATKKKLNALFFTLISALSEPFGAIITYLFLYRYINVDSLNIIFIMVAGLMINLAITEILKESIKYSRKSRVDVVRGLLIGIIFYLLSIIIH